MYQVLSMTHCADQCLPVVLPSSSLRMFLVLLPPTPFLVCAGSPWKVYSLTLSLDQLLGTIFAPSTTRRILPTCRRKRLKHREEVFSPPHNLHNLHGHLAFFGCFAQYLNLYISTIGHNNDGFELHLFLRSAENPKRSPHLAMVLCLLLTFFYMSLHLPS